MNTEKQLIILLQIIMSDFVSMMMKEIPIIKIQGLSHPPKGDLTMINKWQKEADRVVTSLLEITE
jgi:hypothetical protein